jgi:hypothetical protein
VPSLDLRFADSKSLVDSASGQNLITFTRASSATFIDSTGTLQTASTDAPRFDHNPTTGESLGLLVEEARTNSIRNNTMVGAVTGTPGTLPTNWTLTGGSGISPSVVGAGTENGIAYIDVQVNGTPTASTFANIVFDTSIVASSGQAWASSVYVKLTAGSLTNTSIVQEIREVTSLGVYLTNSTLTVTPTSAALNTQRVLLSRTLNNASTTNVRPIVSFQTTNGAAIDFTLRIGLPQLEQGAFATSVIPTTTAAATRAADVATITGSAFSSWYRQDEGTVFAEYRDIGITGANRFVYQVSDGTGSNRIGFFVSGTTTINNRHVAAGTQVNPTTLSTILNGRNRHAIACAVGSCNAASGGTLATASSPSSMPSVTQLSIGALNAGEFLNASISRLTYWPTRLPNTTLQRMTQ